MPLRAAMLKKWLITHFLQDSTEQLTSNRNDILPCSRQGRIHYATQGDRDQLALGALLAPWASQYIFCRQKMLQWFYNPQFPTFQENFHWTWPHILLKTLKLKPPKPHLKPLASFKKNPDIVVNYYFIACLEFCNMVLQCLLSVKGQYFYMALVFKFTWLHGIPVGVCHSFRCFAIHRTPGIYS